MFRAFQHILPSYYSRKDSLALPSILQILLLWHGGWPGAAVKFVEANARFLEVSHGVVPRSSVRNHHELGDSNRRVVRRTPGSHEFKIRV